MDDPITDARLLPLRCGTCEHVHTPDPAVPCEGCGCVFWVQHGEDRDRLGERELMEMVDFGDRRTLLSVHDADALLHSLTAWEAEDVQPHGWERGPALAGISAMPAVDENGPYLFVAICPMRFPVGFWKAASNPMDVVEALSVQAVRESDWWAARCSASGLDDPGFVVVGWAMVAEGYAKTAEHADVSANRDPSVRVEEIRTVAACDLDSRFYTVHRLRSTDEVHAEVQPPRQYVRAAAQAMIAAGLDPVQRMGGSGLPRNLRCLRRLARLSAAQASVNQVFEQMRRREEP